MLVSSKTFDEYKTAQQEKNKQLFDKLSLAQHTIETERDSNKMLIEDLSNQIAELTGKVDELFGIRELLRSDEPWVEVIGGDVDPEKGLQMKLDWNDAFIDQLRSNGFKGTSESALVGQWLLTVSDMVAPEGGE